MPDLPLITVITPSYNQADYLEQTILSVLGQDYPNFEYIIVDGGSTDGSLEIIRRYADRLAWWVSEPDRGQADAINKGLALAKGEIVAWLNSDDYYLPGTLASVAEVFRPDPNLGLAYGDVLSVDSQGKVFNVMRFEDYSLEDLMCFRIIGQAGVFMRRKVQQKAGTLNPDFHFLLDHHLWLRMAQIASVRYTRQLWAAARFHLGAKNVAQAALFGSEAYKILDWMQTQPDLVAKLARLRRRSRAGAYRFDARYLLDGGQYWNALKTYGRCFWQHPPTALPEWHRIVYALLALFGLEKLKPLYLRLRIAFRSQSEPEIYKK